MEDQTVQTREFREAMFSEIYVWLNTGAEDFESYRKAHLMMMLNWGSSDLALKTHLNANNGDLAVTAMKLSDNFKKDFSGNISYLTGMLDNETVDHMIRLVQLFIKESLQLVAKDT